MAMEPETGVNAREMYAHLERAYVLEYLHGLGQTMESLHELPAEQAKEIMRAASIYASTKLSEVEARAHLVEELHGGTKPL